MDVNNVFLYGDLNEEVYMVHPHGFCKIRENKVCRLKKSLYDLKQASKQWNHNLSEALVEVGFVQSKNDHSLYTMNKGSVSLFLLVYVDDLVITGNDIGDIESFKILLSNNQHMHARLKSHFDISLRVLKYLKLAAGLVVEFSKGKSIFDVTAYSYSKWVKCPITRKSMLGYRVFVNGNFVSWKSKKHALLSKFLAEAEYKAMASATCEIMWIVKVLKDFNADGVILASLFCDNTSAIQIAPNHFM
ncbi:ribonuclease H-like domain-containing protein [Tanacetum coccineum]